MKRYVLTITMIFGLLFAGTLQAQNFDNVYRKYKSERGIVSFKIGGFGCKLLGLFAGDDADEGGQFLKKTSGLSILVNENGTNESLYRDVQKFISKSSMEPLMNISDGADKIDIYIQDKKKEIRQLLIVVGDKEDQVVLHLKGKYPWKMIKEMLNENTGNSIVKAVM